MSYYLKKFWKMNTAAIILQILAFGIYTSLNLILMQTFQGIIERDFHRFLFWLAIDTVGWALYLIIRSVQTLFQGRAVRAMNNQLRHDISATLLNKSHLEYHAKDSGEYLSQFTNGVDQIEKLAWNPFFELIGCVTQIVFSIAALTTLHWSIVVASLVSALIMIAAPKLFQKKIERTGSVCVQQQAAAVSKLKDLLSGYNVLRFFSRSDRFIQGTDSASDQIEKPQYRLTYTQGFIDSGLAFVCILCQLIVNVLIAVLSIHGVIIQSALMGGGNLCSAVSNGLNSIASLRLSFSASKPYFDQIAVRQDRAQPNIKQSMEPVKDAITIEHLCFQYEQKLVLQDLTARFEIGKKYALTGPSGCGKSTLLKLLIGWLPDYAGAIRFDGRDIRNYTAEQIQQQMSYIDQDVFLFNTTIRENIMLGETFPDEQLHQVLSESALAGDLANMPDGLDTIVGEHGSNLSGGQKQRVAIARALIHRRSILLVDEGTSALDQKNADIVEKSLLSNPNLTLILVSHHLTPERKKQFDQVYELG